jgi:hypothetical protein
MWSFYGGKAHHYRNRRSLVRIPQREQLVFHSGSKSTPLSDKESHRPVLTLVRRMEYCEGLHKAVNCWINLAWPRFEPGSPKWHTGDIATIFQWQRRVTSILARIRILASLPTPMSYILISAKKINFNGGLFNVKMQNSKFIVHIRKP